MSVSPKEVPPPAAGSGPPFENVKARSSVDNLLRTEHGKLKVRFSVINLTNTEALYNFLSTFSGTHFVTPRAYQVQAGVSF